MDLSNQRDLSSPTQVSLVKLSKIVGVVRARGRDRAWAQFRIYCMCNIGCYSKIYYMYTYIRQ